MRRICACCAGARPHPRTSGCGCFWSSPRQDAREVPDPYYGGPNGFEEVLDLVEAAARGLRCPAHLRQSAPARLSAPLTPPVRAGAADTFSTGAEVHTTYGLCPLRHPPGAGWAQSAPAAPVRERHQLTAARRDTRAPAARRVTALRHTPSGPLCEPLPLSSGTLRRAQQLGAFAPSSCTGPRALACEVPSREPPPPPPRRRPRRGRAAAPAALRRSLALRTHLPRARRPAAAHRPTRCSSRVVSPAVLALAVGEIARRAVPARCRAGSLGDALGASPRLTDCGCDRPGVAASRSRLRSRPSLRRPSLRSRRAPSA